jgi:hypothetical protein
MRDPSRAPPDPIPGEVILCLSDASNQVSSRMTPV